MKRKSVPLNLRTDELFKKRLDTASSVLDVPAAQIVRESVNEKLEALARKKPALREALEKVA